MMANVDPFLFWGFFAGLLRLAIYLIVVFALKPAGKKADLAEALEILACCIAASGAAKAGWKCTQAALHHQPVVLSGEDISFAILGCVALIWVSAATVVRAMK